MEARETRKGSAASWCAAVLVSGLLAGACCTASGAPRRVPKQEVFDQEVVAVTVDYEKQRITVEPESVRIYFQWSSKRQDPLKPVQARWVVKGLHRGDTIHITPKDKAPEVIFPFPDRYRGKPAYSIDGQHNSIVSGEVQGLPGLVKEKGYTNRRKVRDGEPYEVVWPYEVTVTNREGEELFRVDPEIIIAGHPPCC